MERKREIDNRARFAYEVELAMRLERADAELNRFGFDTRTPQERADAALFAWQGRKINCVIAPKPKSWWRRVRESVA